MTFQLNRSPSQVCLRSMVLAAALALVCTASLAEKPDWAGGGHGEKGEKGDKGKKGDKGDKGDKHAQKHSDKHNDRQPERLSAYRNDGYGQRSGPIMVGSYFGPPQRVVINNYYGNEYRSGRCPPGLAKKKNGCMPPGQAKKYYVGQRLPGNVIYYDVPQRVVYQLGAPPSGYRYVRVASDILLLAVGTGMVVDAIQGLSGY